MFNRMGIKRRSRSRQTFKKPRDVVILAIPPGGPPEEPPEEPPVMYDGADNTSTSFATLLCYSDVCPSPQVVSDQTGTFDNYPHRAFNQYDTGAGNWYGAALGVTPSCLMVDFGEGRAKLINKYSLANAGANYRPKDWVLQGSNTVGCAASDAKNANGWTDLDTRTASEALVGTYNDATYITFICGVAYRYIRLYITDTAGGYASYRVRLDELRLVEDGVYNGGKNASTVYATLDATADDAPSPQVCSDSGPTSGTYPPWKAFNQASESSQWRIGTAGGSVQSLMVDLGAGNEKIVNKYSISGYAGTYSDDYDVKDWILQGTNNESAAAGDAKNANGWTDLDVRANSHIFTSWDVPSTTFLTFINGTAYRFYRMRITASGNPNILGTSGDPATYPPQIRELKLVAQVVV